MSCKQILIFGMHHTGTSILSNLTMEMGIYGGEKNDFIYSKKNPMKFWERRDIVQINQDRFDEFDSNYDMPSWSGYSYDGKGTPVYKRENAISVINKLDEMCTWVTKDPRLSLLAKEWMPLFKNPVCIFVKRDKNTTIESICRKKINMMKNINYKSNVASIDFDFQQSQCVTSKNVNYKKWSELYDKYYENSESACSNTTSVTIYNDEIVQNPTGTISKLSKFFKDNDVTHSVKPNVFFNRQDEAYVTLLTTTDSGYIKGAKVLIESILERDKKRDIIIMTTEDLSKNFEDMIKTNSNIKIVTVLPIEEFWWNTCEYESTYDKNQRWGKMMTKLHLWNLNYRRILYLDTDSYLLKSMDIIEDDGIFMAQKGKYHTYFNAGVMVIYPNKTIYEKLLNYKNYPHPKLYYNVIDCTEQALLNTVFETYELLDIARPEESVNEKNIAIHWITKVCRKPWIEILYESSKICNQLYYNMWEGTKDSVIKKYGLNYTHEFSLENGEDYENSQMGRMLLERDTEYETGLSKDGFFVYKLVVVLLLSVIVSLVLYPRVYAFYLTYSFYRKGFHVVGNDKPTSCMDEE